jgi:hypothetical protein
VEHEIHSDPEAFLQWLPENQDLAAERHLLGLCLCLDPQQSLQLLLQQAAAAAQVADSSSSSSGGAGGGASRGGMVGGRVCGPDATEGDGMSGNVVAAALQLALELRDRGCAPAAIDHTSNGNSSSTDASFSGRVSDERLQQQQQQQAGGADEAANAASAAADGVGGSGYGSQALKLQRLLQMLRSSLLPQQQHPQLCLEHNASQQQQQQQDLLLQHQQPQHGSGQGVTQQQQQQQGIGSPSVTDVAALITQLVDDCIEQQVFAYAAATAAAAAVKSSAAAAGAIVESAAADSDTAGAAAEVPEPAAAVDAAPAGDVNDKLAAAAVGRQQPSVATEGAAQTAASCQNSNTANVTADAAAWNIAVITGALALARLFPGPDGSDSSSNGPHCPVQAALLFTAIEGLYFGVREELQQLTSIKEAICGCRVCRNGTGSESVTVKRTKAMLRNTVACKTEVTSKVRYAGWLLECFPFPVPVCP